MNLFARRLTKGLGPNGISWTSTGALNLTTTSRKSRLLQKILRRKRVPDKRKRRHWPRLLRLALAYSSVQLAQEKLQSCPFCAGDQKYIRMESYYWRLPEKRAYEWRTWRVKQEPRILRPPRLPSFCPQIVTMLTLNVI